MIKISLRYFLIVLLVLGVLGVSAFTPAVAHAQTVAPTPTATPAKTATPVPLVNVSATVTTGKLNARSGPGLSYPITATFLPGEKVVLTGRNSNSAWVRLASTKFSDVWANTQFLQPASPFSTLPIIDQLADGYILAVNAVVKSAQISVREGPWITYEVLLTLKKDENVGILGKNAAGTWAFIRTTTNKFGWVNITLIEPERTWTRIADKLPIESEASLVMAESVQVGKKVSLEFDSFPQYVPITVTVSSGANVACRVAVGRSGYHGTKVIEFAMPSECPSGSLLAGSTVSVTVTSGDPIYTVSASLKVLK